ncbi:MAG: ATP-binding cassette domain-containing protein [Bacteroidota bacterium]
MEDTLKGRPIKRFFRLLEPDRKEVVYIYLYAIFNGLINLSLPLGIQAIISLILADEISSSWVILIVVVTVGTAMAGGLQIMQVTITEMLQQKIFARASFEFAYRIPRIKAEKLLKYYPPELVNRFFDVMNVQKGLPKILIDFSTASLQILFGLILLSFYNSAFVFFGIGLLVILVLIFRISGPSGLRTSLEESNYKYEVVYWLEEIARTLTNFKLAGNSNLPLKKTDALVSNYLDARKAHFRVLIFQYANIVGFKTIVTAGLLILGSVLLIQREINIGQFVASEIIIITIISSVEKLILSMDTVYDLLTAMEKIGKVTDMPLEAQKGLEYRDDVDARGMELTLRDLKFSYPGDLRPSLNDVDLDIKPGEKVAIIGNVGAGQTLLTGLISGLYDSFEGVIAYNGIPLNNYDRQSLRSNIGDILSRNVLFRGTLEENITMGREEIDYDDLRWVIDNLDLREFIQRMPEGLNTMLVPEGPQMPPSVVRRLIIAKSVIKRPSLLVMEDFIPDREPDIKEKIANFLTQSDLWTLIGASNDPLFVSKCEKVVVMDHGTILEVGTYEEISQKPYFKNFVS